MVRLSSRASSDLDSILDYSIIHFDANVMTKHHESLAKCLDTLDENSDLGTEVAHIRSDYICFEHRSHLIFYKKTKHGILVIRILHKSMDAPRHFS